MSQALRIMPTLLPAEDWASSFSASAKPQGAARRGAEPLHEHRYRWTGDPVWSSGLA